MDGLFQPISYMDQTWSNGSSMSVHYKKGNSATLSGRKSMLDPSPHDKMGSPTRMVYFNFSLTRTKFDQKEVVYMSEHHKKGKSATLFDQKSMFDLPPHPKGGLPPGLFILTHLLH